MTDANSMTFASDVLVACTEWRRRRKDPPAELENVVREIEVAAQAILYAASRPTEVVGS